MQTSELYADQLLCHAVQSPMAGLQPLGPNAATDCANPSQALQVQDCSLPISQSPVIQLLQQTCMLLLINWSSSGESTEWYKEKLAIGPGSVLQSVWAQVMQSNLKKYIAAFGLCAIIGWSLADSGEQAMMFCLTVMYLAAQDSMTQPFRLLLEEITQLGTHAGLNSCSADYRNTINIFTACQVSQRDIYHAQAHSTWNSIGLFMGRIIP